MLMYVPISTIQSHSLGCIYYFQLMHMSPGPGGGTEIPMTPAIHVDPIVQSKGQHALRLFQQTELFQSTVAGTVSQYPIFAMLMLSDLS